MPRQHFTIDDDVPIPDLPRRGRRENDDTLDVMEALAGLESATFNSVYAAACAMAMKYPPHYFEANRDRLRKKIMRKRSVKMSNR
jgi:hypothetical protein